MITSKTNIMKQTTINRIKFAAPITMGMLTLLSERFFCSSTIALFSFEWFYFTIAFFAINTLMFSALMYNYKLLDHSCKNCLNQWSAVESSIISVSNSVFKINLLTRYLLLKVDKRFKTYTCGVCQNIEHKKSIAIKYIGTASK
jgi:hypothetical protein